MKFERILVKKVLGINTNYTDHVGIEVETEGTSIPKIDNEYWRSDADGSLRGENYEYVLKNPVKFEDVGKVLANLKQCWERAGSEVKNSPNAGVHVHINVSDLTITEMYNFISLYLVVENILIQQAGDDRIGNLFCLRASDAEYLLDVIAQSIRERNIKIYHTDELRYAAINLKALGDYGSIEFRSWRSDGDLDGIKWWASMLMGLKDMARKIDNPAQIVADVSMMTPRGFFNSILGDQATSIKWEPEFEHMIIDGVRRVQQYAFLGDW